MHVKTMWGIIALTEEAVIGKQSSVYKCTKVDQKDWLQCGCYINIIDYYNCYFSYILA